MNLKYVQNKSKFIDLDAKRPRLMNLETTARLLETHGILEPDAVLVKLMADPITINNELPKSPHLKIIEQYQIVAKQNQIEIQGLRFSITQALEFLMYQRSIANTDALKTIALAIDLEQLSK